MDGSLVQSVKFLRHSNSTVIVAGNLHLSVWDYDRPNNQLRCTHVQLGQLRLHFSALHVDLDDEFVYCATSSGDVLQVEHLHLRMHLSEDSSRNRWTSRRGSCVAVDRLRHQSLGASLRSSRAKTAECLLVPATVVCVTCRRRGRAVQRRVSNRFVKSLRITLTPRRKARRSLPS